MDSTIATSGGWQRKILQMGFSGGTPRHLNTPGAGACLKLGHSRFQIRTLSGKSPQIRTLPRSGGSPNRSPAGCLTTYGQPFSALFTAARMECRSAGPSYRLHRNRVRPSKPSAATRTTIRPGDISGASAGYGTVTGPLRIGSWQPSVT